MGSDTYIKDGCLDIYSSYYNLHIDLHLVCSRFLNDLFTFFQIVIFHAQYRRIYWLPSIYLHANALFNSGCLKKHSQLFKLMAVLWKQNCISNLSVLYELIDHLFFIRPCCIRIVMVYAEISVWISSTLKRRLYSCTIDSSLCLLLDQCNLGV